MTPHPDTETARRLGAIVLAIGEIERFTVGRTQVDYLRNSMLRSAVLWQLVRIGEAIRELARDDVAVASRITEFRQIIGLRNLLIHEFHIVEHDQVWQYVQTDLPTLHEDVEALLAAAGD